LLIPMRAAGFVSMVLASIAPTMAEGAQELSYVSEAAPVLQAGAAVVDTRPVAACRERSLKGARCLPPAEFLGPHGRLAAIPDVLWILGTAGLSGEETVLVVGEEPAARDFVAGLLHLAGQRRIAVLRAPMSRGLGLPPGSFAAGIARAMVREKVFQAPMRDDLWVLRHELAERLAQRLPVILLDGRSESEFWGETVRAARGGHVPGAESLPAQALRAAIGRGERIGPLPREAVAYAHNALEGIAYYALLRAGAGVSVRLYPGGWAEWAADGGLPADAATYPERIGSRAAATGELPASDAFAWLPLFAGMALGAMLAAGGFYLGRAGRRAEKSA
jgi:thiosulfate/3-mercaptopyruvate sulfurtransferase